MDYKYRIKHLEEMSLVAEAVYHIFEADKMNHAMLGILDSHVHWHLIPRLKGDAPAGAPIWKLPDEELFHESYRPDKTELTEMAKKLRDEINHLISRNRN
jgi:diadenosine tetraphosphate (Ap4A) HIT family hydrolase